MSKETRTQERIERTVAEVRNLIAKARAIDVADVEAIAEQLRVEAMLANTTRHRRRIFDALADHYEHVAGERRAAEKHDDPEAGIGGAVRAILENFDSTDEREEDEPSPPGKRR